MTVLLGSLLLCPALVTALSARRQLDSRGQYTDSEEEQSEVAPAKEKPDKEKPDKEKPAADFSSETEDPRVCLVWADDTASPTKSPTKSPTASATRG